MAGRIQRAGGALAMDTAWLEDFLALATCANFSRAAEQRHMTQPAFSRRIRQLEDWAGTPLFNRDTHRIVLTPAGERFHPVADEMLRRLHFAREEALEAAEAASLTLRFAATHALSLTFFPSWLRGLEAREVVGPISLAADHMQACEQLMLQGRANFLLCHHHPSAATLLQPPGFSAVILGTDTLMPVTAPGPDGAARHRLPGSSEAPTPLLAYSSTSGMGRIIAAARPQDARSNAFRPVFTSHVATVLKSLALTGRGIAWSPRSLVADELADGRLVRAGDRDWDVEIEIRLLRPRARQSRAAEAFWDRIVKAASAPDTG